MLVGPQASAKTTVYKVLSDALSSEETKSNASNFQRVDKFIIDPKSLTISEFYGVFDQISHEFTDGVLGKLFRDCTVVQNPPLYQWIIFDGPVDSLWIESMNTVLDDNKKLCLNSGQILKLTPHMTMMFEVEDLAVASPATVSRCGMVYM